MIKVNPKLFKVGLEGAYIVCLVVVLGGVIGFTFSSPMWALMEFAEPKALFGECLRTCMYMYIYVHA